MPTSSDGRSGSPTNEQEALRRLVEELAANGHEVAHLSQFAGDVRRYTEDQREAFWSLTHEWYRQRILQQPPQRPLRCHKAPVHSGGGSLDCQVIEIESDLRLALIWRKGTLTFVRAGGHSGGNRIYLRSSS
jgi:hypothetical protein